MSFVLVGAKEDRIGLGTFSSLVIPEPEVAKHLKELRALSNVRGVILLSTCLRTEIYADVDKFHEGADTISQWFLKKSDFKLNPTDLSILYDYDALKHIFRVACGLDSAILGENEILSQVRRARGIAKAEGASSLMLDSVFIYAARAGRIARAKTDISKGSQSFAQIVSNEVAKFSATNSFENVTVNILGTGTIAKELASTLSKKKFVNELRIIGRSKYKARTLAKQFNASSISLLELPSYLRRESILISAVLADDFVLKYDMLAGYLDKFPQLAIDVSVPASIDPKIVVTSGSSLITLEDINSIASASKAKREKEIKAIEEIIELALKSFFKSANERMLVPIIRKLYEKVDKKRLELLKNFFLENEKLNIDNHELLDQLSMNLVKSIIDEPVRNIKEVAKLNPGGREIELFNYLFGLK